MFQACTARTACHDELSPKRQMYLLKGATERGKSENLRTSLVGLSSQLPIWASSWHLMAGVTKWNVTWPQQFEFSTVQRNNSLWRSSSAFAARYWLIHSLVPTTSSERSGATYIYPSLQSYISLWAFSDQIPTWSGFRRSDICDHFRSVNWRPWQESK